MAESTKYYYKRKFLRGDLRTVEDAANAYGNQGWSAGMGSLIHEGNGIYVLAIMTQRTNIDNNDGKGAGPYPLEKSTIEI